VKPIEPVYRLFGARIEQLRTLLGRTQEETAKTLNISRGSLANIETGKQRILLHDVEKFAVVFGTNPRALMKGIWI
jgi:transcriptional regulator with XRE-family HTH domain